MPPYRQGDFDGLCGIYSILNAVRIIRGLNVQRSQELFHEIIKYLYESDKHNLSEILIDGMNIKVIGSIFRHVIKQDINRKMPFLKVDDILFRDFWNAMVDHLAIERRAILIGLEGRHDHWTVVNRITYKRIYLMDSDGLLCINRSKCTIGEQNSHRHHVLVPKNTYFLS